MVDQIGELAKLLSSTSLTDAEFTDGDLWEKRTVPITRPFLIAVMERFCARVTKELETTLEINYKPKPRPPKPKKVETRDYGRVDIPVNSQGIKGFAVGIRVGDASYLENHLIWGASWWGEHDLVSEVEDRFNKIRIEDKGEEVRAFKDRLFKGGTYCYLAKSLSPSELRSRDEQDLIEEMAEDLFSIYDRLRKWKGDSVESIVRYFAAQGFNFTRHQLATFYIALKTKGFVILSGLSGTGKTKLAQLFAELMASKVESLEEQEISEFDIRVQVRPYMLKYARMIIPKGYWKLIDVPPAGETVEVDVAFDGGKEKCRFGHAAYSGTDYLALYLRGELQKWFVSSFQQGDIVLLEPIVDEESNFVGFRLSHPKVRRISKREENCRFVSVRPDWRDSKSLLGYYNPLSGQFESTEFLRFLLQACDNYRSSLHELKWEAQHPSASTLLAEPEAFSTDRIRLRVVAFDTDGHPVAEQAFEFNVNEGRQLSLLGQMSELGPFRNAAKIYGLELDRVYPHFIILDEMNLARVEYYFADFLSVLESGRAKDGWTREDIALHDFQTPVEDATGNAIPACIKLPPNLYFAGTVNVDETTYMFSPKVLDRAFTIEFTEVDFEHYPLQEGEGLSGEELENLRQQLLKDFARGGKFAIVGKGAIAAFAARHPTCGEQLDRLKALLQPYDLHFAYRVFDEIMAFLANVEGSPVSDGFGDLDDTFDTAVLMKVLPKFHGPKGKLEEPLLRVLNWARKRNAPEVKKEDLKNQKEWLALITDLRTLLPVPTTESGEMAEDTRVKAGDFAYPRTALKALRMLHALYTTGFASFA